MGTTAEKIGLLPGFGWLTDHSPLATLLIALAITPGMMFVIGIIGEGRLLPVSPSKQFLSFFPGDIFLGMTIAFLLVYAQALPDVSAWYNSTLWHICVFVGALLVACLLTLGEYNDSNGYAREALLSPTKLYHNFALYWLLGYVGVSTLVAHIGALVANFSWGGLQVLALCLAPGVVWVALLFLEQNDTFLRLLTSIPGEQVKLMRVRSAHVADWQPLWP